MNLGLKLRQLRDSCGYSQEYIASILGMSQANYCRIENDRLSISIDKLSFLAKTYSVSVADFFDDFFHKENKSNLEKPVTNKQNSPNEEELLKLKEQIILLQNRQIDLLEEKLRTIQH